MNIHRLKKQLKIDEGVRSRVYMKDDKRIVGVGHIIDETAPEWLANKNIGEAITDEQLDLLFMDDLTIAIAVVKTIFEPMWDDLSSCSKEGLSNLCFAIGKDELLQLKEFIYFIYQGDLDNAEKDLINTPWGINNTARAIRIMRMINRED